MTDESKFTLAVLTKARNLIDKKGWTQHAYARNRSGHSVDAADPGAVCFCMTGAIHLGARYTTRAGLDPLVRSMRIRYRSVAARHAVYQVLKKVRPSVSGIAAWNDVHATSKEEVLAVFDKAIAKAKKAAA